MLDFNISKAACVELIHVFFFFFLFFFLKRQTNVTLEPKMTENYDDLART